MDKKYESIKCLDEIDTKIIKILSHDSRTPYRAIADKLEISVGTIHNRIEKLMERNIIKRFTAQVDHKVRGFNITAIIGIKLNDTTSLEWLKDSNLIKSIVVAYDVTGEYDAFIVAKFKNTDELNEFIKELGKKPHVNRTYTQTVLNILKEDFESLDLEL
jgi:Lrp/AsnC family transcriptional regulator for asnA, asnC and gidA